MEKATLAISAKKLSRHFGGRSALKSVNLQIRAGESLGLIGPNGAGKTTFLRLVTGILLPSDGCIEIFGNNPIANSQDIGERIAYVPEHPLLYDELKVDEFLRFSAGIRGLTGAKKESSVTEQLARFDLGNVRRSCIGHLSLGFRRRVALAQAFLGNPQLVLLDEPTAGLDPLHRQAVHEFLNEARRNRTLLLCTHDLHEVRTLTRQIAVLEGGKIVKSGKTEDLLNEGNSLYRDTGPELR